MTEHTKNVSEHAPARTVSKRTAQFGLLVIATLLVSCLAILFVS